MSRANIPNVVKDEAKNNTYIFYAYRKLKNWELRRLLGVALAQKKCTGRNKRYISVTSIGGREPIDHGGWR
jgi:hypothetical protein